MFSRSKRIFGIAALTFAATTTATTATVAPAHAEEILVTEFNLLRELQGPLCAPHTVTGIELVDTLLPQIVACAQS